MTTAAQSASNLNLRQQTVDADDLRAMLAAFAAAVREQHPLLTDLDCASGDGDHGTTMLCGAERTEAVLRATPADAMPRALFEAVGWEFVGLDGGASGPLAGMIFLGMGAGSNGRTLLDAAALAVVLEGGLSRLRTKTSAQRGDKTMLDALIPAVEAFHAAADAGQQVAVCMTRAAAAATDGAAATRGMVARFGRAKNLGERTLGHQDPGSTTVAILFTAFAETLRTRKEDEHG